MSSLINNDLKLLSPHNGSLAYLPSVKYSESENTHQLSALLFHVVLVRELGSHHEGENGHDLSGRSVINIEVIAHFMMKRSQQKSTFLIALDFKSNKKYLRWKRIHLNTSLVSALIKQQKLVLVSNESIATMFPRK